MTVFLIGLTMGAMLTPAHAAPVGNPFLRGVGSPEELAKRIEDSLHDHDQNGRAIIDINRCRQDGACARPVDYLKMFQESDPGASLVVVDQLTAFLRKLVEESAPDGEYWMACLKYDPYRPVLHCVSRRFKPGEKAWVNPATHRIVLASDCTNPVEKEVPKRCVEVHVFTRATDTELRFELSVGQDGPNSIANDCIAVLRAGSEQKETWWTDECAYGYCSFADFNGVYGQKQLMVGSYVPEPGEHVFFLPEEVAMSGSKFRFVACLDREGLSSDTIGVQWFDYLLVEPSQVKMATIWYSKDEVPPWAPTIYWPWGEWPPASITEGQIP